MALDDITSRTYALPVYLVAAVIQREIGTVKIQVNLEDYVNALTNAVTEGLNILEDRFFKESSTAIFDGLTTQMYDYTFAGYSQYDISLKRRHQIILRCTAKEYSKSQDELLSFYLMQYLSL